MNKYVFKPDRFSSHSLLLQEFDDIGKGRYVLDVGCGQGKLSRILANRGYQVIGLDKDSASLRHAAHWCCDVIEADIENWIGYSKIGVVVYIVVFYFTILTNFLRIICVNYFFFKLNQYSS